MKLIEILIATLALLAVAFLLMGNAPLRKDSLSEDDKLDLCLKNKGQPVTSWVTGELTNCIFTK